MPVDLIQALFASLDPQLVVRKFLSFAAFPGPDQQLQGARLRRAGGLAERRRAAGGAGGAGVPGPLVRRQHAGPGRMAARRLGRSTPPAWTCRRFASSRPRTASCRRARRGRWRRPAGGGGPASPRSGTSAWWSAPAARRPSGNRSGDLDRNARLEVIGARPARESCAFSARGLLWPGPRLSLYQSRTGCTAKRRAASRRPHRTWRARVCGSRLHSPLRKAKAPAKARSTQEREDSEHDRSRNRRCGPHACRMHSLAVFPASAASHLGTRRHQGGHEARQGRGRGGRRRPSWARS